MEITVTGKDGKPQIIPLKGLLGKDITELTKLMRSMQNGADAEFEKNTDKYITRLNEIAAKISNRSVEELDELEAEDKEKIISYIVERIKNNMGFGVLSRT